MSAAILAAKIPVNSEITLRTASPEHAQMLFDTTEKNRSFLRLWLPWLDTVKTPADSLRFIEHNQALAEQGKAVQFLIFSQKELIGVCGFHNRDMLYRNADMGYWLSKSHTGKGIMSECVKALLSYGFHTLKLRKIGIRCATTNLRSRKIPQRLGFTLEFTRKRCEWLYDHYVDHDIFHLVYEDFAKTQRKT